MTIRQGQTVDVYVETDMETIDSASVSIKSGGVVTKVPEVRVENGSVSFSLSQEDTMALKPGRIEVQIKAKTGEGVAVSNIMTETVLESIGKEVL